MMTVVINVSPKVISVAVMSYFDRYCIITILFADCNSALCTQGCFLNKQQPGCCIEDQCICMPSTCPYEPSLNQEGECNQGIPDPGDCCTEPLINWCLALCTQGCFFNQHEPGCCIDDKCVCIPPTCPQKPPKKPSFVEEGHRGSYNALRSQITPTTNPQTRHDEPAHNVDCNIWECSELCSFRGECGSCFNDQCICKPKTCPQLPELLGSQVMYDEVTRKAQHDISAPTADCNESACWEECEFKGEYGYCIDNKCICEAKSYPLLERKMDEKAQKNGFTHSAGCH